MYVCMCIYIYIYIATATHNTWVLYTHMLEDKGKFSDEPRGPNPKQASCVIYIYIYTHTLFAPSLSLALSPFSAISCDHVVLDILNQFSLWCLAASHDIRR